MKKALLLWLTIFWLTFPTTVSYGQQTNQAEAVIILQQVLQELRLLRQTLQTVNIYTFRSQMTFESVRVQQDRVTRLVIANENLRNEISNLELQATAFEERIKELNAKTDREPNSKEA